MRAVTVPPFRSVRLFLPMSRRDKHINCTHMALRKRASASRYQLIGDRAYARNDTRSSFWGEQEEEEGEVSVERAEDTEGREPEEKRGRERERVKVAGLR